MPVKYRLLVASLLAASLWAAAWLAVAAALVVCPLYVHGELTEHMGNYAPLYLHDGPYDRIVIEVHCEQGIQPSVPALEHLRSIMHKYTGKAVDLYVYEDIAPDMLPASTDNDNISAFGKAFLDGHARCRTGWLGGNAVMYVLYVNGSAPMPATKGGSSVAGVSFGADTFAVFDNYIHTDGIERTVLVHETGHLLGLDHDGDPGCVMAGRLVENLSILTGRTSPPDDFCAEDVRQLERVRDYLV